MRVISYNQLVMNEGGTQVQKGMNFGIKKTHSLARTVVVGRLFTMIDITATSRFGTLRCCVVRYASRECVSSRF